MSIKKIEEELLQVEHEDDEAPEVLIEYDIASYPSDYTLNVLLQMWNDGDITIPDFQRSFVWTINQSSLLIESFLIGLPVPPLFFYIDPNNKNLVVDGQQRLMSIIYFLEEFFGPENDKGKRQTFRLTGLSPKSKYYNRKFSELDSTDQRKLNGSVLRAINIRQLSPKEENTSIYHIFERLNTGGTPLTAQEIRNVVFRGDFFSKLKELNKDKNWRIIIGKKTLDKHQKDIELILRAFGLCTYFKDYEKPMKEFLNKVSDRNKNRSSGYLTRFIENFPVATKLIAEKIGEKAFHVRGPLNTSVFDSIFCTIINNIDKIPDDIKQRFLNLIVDKNFVELTSLATTDTKIVKERFAYVETKLIK